ncbi:MAG: hypothetical protein ACK52I_26945 [Pseudomonadota bacterium]
MSWKRYQLWMRLMFFNPGNPAETRTQGRVNFAYRIIDTQATDFRSQQSEVLNDGYSFYGQSDNPSDVENFAREMEGQQ